MNRGCFQYVHRLHSPEDVELDMGGRIELQATCEPGTTGCYMCPNCGRLVDELECNGVCTLCEPTKISPVRVPWQLFWWFYRLIRQYRMEDEHPGGFTHWKPRGLMTPEFRKPTKREER